MAYTDYQPYTMGIREISIRRAGSLVALGASQTAEVTAQVVAGTLRGSGKIVAANSYIEGGEVKFGVGGWPLAALPIMLGISAISPTGSTPNRITTISPVASSALPYFEIAARTSDPDGGDMHFYAAKAKCMSGFPFTIKDGAEFTAPEITVQLVPDASSIPFKLLYYETSTAVASSFPAGTTVTATSAAATNSIVTITKAAHGMSAGTWVAIAGCTETYADVFNGLKQIIAVPTVDTFTFAAVGAGTDASVSGTITYSY